MNFIVIVESSLPGNKVFVVVYEKLVLCETIESFSTDDEHDYEYEFSSFSQLYS